MREIKYYTVENVERNISVNGKEMFAEQLVAQLQIQFQSQYAI